MTATLDSLGEAAIAERIRIRFAGAAGPGEIGPGDDAAVLMARGDRMVLTVDTQREGIHFRREWLDAATLARRAVAVAVSDLAAMGALPRCTLCSLVLPPGIAVEWFDALLDGLVAAGAELDAPVVGGDVTRSIAGVSLCITAIGHLHPGDPVPRRDGARPGDLCMVFGALGRAAAGRALLADAGGEGGNAREVCVDAYRRPQPLLGLGRSLAGRVQALMDISDGLAMDLTRMCRASGVGATVEAGSLEDSSLTTVAGELGADATAWALRGGDDYALLAATDEQQAPSLEACAREAGVTARVVGRFDEQLGLRLRRGDSVEAIGDAGWDPFRGEGAT